jgi:FkbM family methyltransferase
MALLQVFSQLLKRAMRSRRQVALQLAQCAAYARDILGEQTFVAADIGAAIGLLPHWESLDGVATIYQIEPREDACDVLRTQNSRRSRPDLYHVIETALAERSGLATLYVSNAPTGSSLLKPGLGLSSDCSDYVAEDYLYPLTERQIAVESLAALLDRVDEERLDLIKLDVQGSELPIIRGLDETRRGNLLGAELEIGLHDLYPDQARFGEVVSYLGDQGLELFDVRVARAYRPFRGDGEYYQRRIFGVYGNSPTIAARIWEFDAVFFRRKSALLAERSAAKIRRMMLAYCSYNFFSEAHCLAEKAEAEGIFSVEETNALKGVLVDLHRRRHFAAWLADTPQMERWRRLMYRIAPRSAPRWCQYMYQSYPNG